MKSGDSPLTLHLNAPGHELARWPLAATPGDGKKAGCVSGNTNELSKKSSKTVEWSVPKVGFSGDTFEIKIYPFTTGMGASENAIHFIYVYSENNITPPEPPDPPIYAGGVKIESVADSHVYAYSYRNWNKCNWGKYDVLGAGWHPTGGQKRAYLKFDLSGVDPQKVNKAILRLFHYHTGGGPTPKLGVHKVTGTWNEGEGTYHSGQTESPAAPGEIAWVAQPRFENVAVASFSPGAGTNKYVEVDVTELVNGWLSGKPNYGLVITPEGTLSRGTPESAYGFYSREREDQTKRPALIIQSAGQPAPSPDPSHITPDTLKNQLRVRAEDRQVTPDTSVTVPVWLEFPKEFPRTRDGRVNVANLNVEIAYDPRVVKPAAKVIAGNLLGGALFQTNTAEAGVIKTGFAAKGRVQTNGTLAQIPFQVVGQPGQRSPLKVTITTVNDDAGGTPAVTTIDGSIQIINAAVIGDINGNGIVDAGDALAALKMSVDLMKEDLILNVDKLNGVTSNDARLLLKMAVQENIAPPRTVEGGSGSSGTAPATPANSAASGANVASLPTQGPDSFAASLTVA